MGPAPAPWRAPFLSHFEKAAAASFSLATVAYSSQNKPVPRSRTVEFRGFFPKSGSSLHPSAVEALRSQNVGLNPDVYESDMLSITTDIRMKKMTQLAESEDVVEGVFWFDEASAQWRVRGRAYAIGSPASKDGSLEEEEIEARGKIQKGMRLVEGVKADGEEVNRWGWERQVTAYFANHTPVMRGSFKNPPPGRPRSEVPSDPELKLNQKVEDLNDPVARANFRVLVIRPEEVERLEFSNPEDVRRTNWAFVEGEGGGRWEETELWP